MKQEDKKLLLKDLSARLPYKVKVCLYGKETCILMGIDGYEVYLDVDSDSFRIESIKPYLRPMSSMTEKEKLELYSHYCKEIADNLNTPNLTWEIRCCVSDSFGTDWLNAHHFDYRGLIPKGLALEAKEGMYKKN